MRTTPVYKIPRGVTVALRNAYPVFTDKAPEGALIVGRVRFNGGKAGIKGESTYLVTTQYGQFDFLPKEPITWSDDAKAAVDAKVCQIHGEVFRVFRGGSECASCFRTAEAARRAAKKEGTYVRKAKGGIAVREGETVEQARTRVDGELAKARSRSRDEQIGSVLRRQLAGAPGRWQSKAQQAAYAAAAANATAASYGITHERAEELAGFPFPTTTWAQYREAYGRTTRRAEAAMTPEEAAEHAAAALSA